jgi:hypothetical protein
MVGMSDTALGRGLAGLGEERKIPVAPSAEPAFDAHRSTVNSYRLSTKFPASTAGYPTVRKPRISPTTAFNIWALPGRTIRLATWDASRVDCPGIRCHSGLEAKLHGLAIVAASIQ